MTLVTAPNGARLMLPWPDKILNPNNRSYWRKKQGAKKAAREAGYLLAYNLNVKLDPGKHYQVELVFCPPNKQARDLDNLLASCKSAIDGMCRALGIDDRMIRPVPDWGPVVEGGKVEVTIVERVNRDGNQVL